VAGEEGSQAMPAQPLYSAQHQQSAFALRYSWTGWITQGDIHGLPNEAWTELITAWETDGLRLFDRLIRDSEIHLTFSGIPSVTPILVAARAKGRLQYALRMAGAPVTFSRKVSIRTVGNNTTPAIEGYIRAQVRNEDFIDPRFAEFLEQFTIINPRADLRQPAETNSGRYWYNLHLVLVTEGRHRIIDGPGLRTIRDGAFKIAEKKEYAIGAISVMPDHVHLALRGNLEHSPEQIALAFQNNLAYMLNRGAVWRRGFYVGTFGEYDMRAIRKAGRVNCSAVTL
jgi:REP element-mobilizing transposase RayT